MQPDRFYLVVPDADWIERLVPLGVRTVQLRIKDQPQDVVRGQLRRSLACCARHGATLVLNDYWRLAIDEGCEWLHLGQEDLADAELPTIRHAGIRLGISTHDAAELVQALAAEPDYVALGPVYPTRLKAMRWAPQGLARLASWKRLVGRRPLVAIGGLNVERLPGVFAAGADSAAVVTDITLHADPEARTREWIRATRSP